MRFDLWVPISDWMISGHDSRLSVIDVEMDGLKGERPHRLLYKYFPEILYNTEELRRLATSECFEKNYQASVWYATHCNPFFFLGVLRVYPFVAQWTKSSRCAIGIQAPHCALNHKGISNGRPERFNFSVAFEYNALPAHVHASVPVAIMQAKFCYDKCPLRNEKVYSNFTIPSVIHYTSVLPSLRIMEFSDLLKCRTNKRVKVRSDSGKRENRRRGFSSMLSLYRTTSMSWTDTTTSFYTHCNLFTRGQWATDNSEYRILFSLHHCSQHISPSC